MLLKTIIVVLVLAIMVASVAFFSIWRAFEASNAQLRTRHIPVNVRVIEGEGIYSSFEAKSQIVRYGRLVSTSPIHPYNVVERFSGVLFPLQDVLRVHVLEFEYAALSDMRAFGYENVQIHQIYAIDFNADATLSVISAMLSVTGSGGETTFIPYVRFGNYAVTHTFGLGMKTIDEVFEKYLYVFGFSGAPLVSGSGDIRHRRIPPQAVDFENISPVNRSIIKGDFLSPNSFTNNGDINITASFDTVIPFNLPGQNTISINLQNETAEIRTIEAILTVYDGKRHITQEADSNGEYMNLGRFFAPSTDLSNINFITNEIADNEMVFDSSVPGFYYKSVEIDGDVSHLTISVIDTTPPIAESNIVTTAIGFPVSAEAFVQNIHDYSSVSVSFLGGEPNVFITGEVEVPILLTDEFGNAAVVMSKLIILDQEFLNPGFEYIPNRYFQIGEPVDFLYQVKVRNGSDPLSVVTYNTSLVNENEPGRYRVYYTITDRNNNTDTVFAYIVKTNAPLERVMSYADRILDSIITDEMTQLEKSRAIFNWTRENIAYSFSSERDDPVLGAFTAFTRARGDCFIFYSAAEILLTRAGIKNIQVSRIPGESARHYWHFVNVGDGWYHFDTTPFIGSPGNGFMFNDATAASLTAARGRNYYTYDRSLFEHLDIR